MLPTQSHAHASAVAEAIESARDRVGALLGADPFELVFTSGGTEANNLAILGSTDPATGAAKTPPSGRAPHLLVASIEHESVLLSAQHLSRMGWDVESVPCDPDGLVDVEQFAARVRPTTRLACLQLANPVLGTIQPVRELADFCHGRGVRVHCDATAAVGKVPVDAAALRVDTLAISGHKMYGPKGCGVLYVRRGLGLQPTLHGEPREMGLRAGSENVPGIVGLGAAAYLAHRCVHEAAITMAERRQQLIDGLREVIGPELEILAEGIDGLPNTVSVQMPTDAKRIQRAARQLVVASAQSDQPPDEMTRVLQAIGRSDKQIGRTLRLSVGWTTSQDQVERAINLLAEATECPSH